MLTLQLDTNAAQVSRILRRLFADQIPFALSRAVNDVTEEAQERQRTHQRRIFQVRRSTFVDRAVKVKPRATKRSPFAIIAINPPGGQKRADIISKFETQRRKVARSGTIAIPVGARRTKAGIISARDRPRALGLQRHGPSGRVLRGARRTVLIRSTPGGEGTIFQRVGRGASSELRPLWLLRREVRIDPELNFTANVTKTVAQRFPMLFDQRLGEAVRSAR